MSQKTALVIDDTAANLDFLERLITAAGFTVKAANSGKAALEHLRGVDDLTLAVVDMQLPDMNGLQLTAGLRQRYPAAYLVVATMYDERSLMDASFQKGSNAYLVKPHGFMELFKRITTMDLNQLRESGPIVIDQYGPRPFALEART